MMPWWIDPLLDDELDTVRLTVYYSRCPDCKGVIDLDSLGADYRDSNGELAAPHRLQDKPLWYDSEGRSINWMQDGGTPGCRVLHDSPALIVVWKRVRSGRVPYVTKDGCSTSNEDSSPGTEPVVDGIVLPAVATAVQQHDDDYDSRILDGEFMGGQE